MVTSVTIRRTPEEEEKMQQIELMFEKDNSKFSKIRSALAHKNQEIALLSRKMDDIRRTMGEEVRDWLHYLILH